MNNMAGDLNTTSIFDSDIFIRGSIIEQNAETTIHSNITVFGPLGLLSSLWKATVNGISEMGFRDLAVRMILLLSVRPIYSIVVKKRQMEH